MFDFSAFTVQLLIQALILIIIGILIRIVAAFLISYFTDFNMKERMFASICFFPKATVQAALAPVLVSFSISYFDLGFDGLILQTNILSILVTAPIGQLMIMGLGKLFLSKPDQSNKDTTSNIGCKNDVVDLELNVSGKCI